MLLKQQISYLSFCCLKKQFHGLIGLTAASQKNNLGTIYLEVHQLFLSYKQFRAPRWPTRAKAPPLKSIVNGINLTLRHQLLSPGTVWVVGESLKLRQKKSPRKDKKDLRIFFEEAWSVPHVTSHLGLGIMG